MLRNTTIILAGLLLGAAIGFPTATANTNNAVVSQCLFNDECDGTLVCSGSYCRSACRSDRDCGTGERCLAGGTDHAACEAITPPVVPGTITGRVESAFGVPLTSCEVQIIGGASTRCDSRGEFEVAGVAPGRHQVRVRAPNRGLAPRTVSVRVNAGVAANVGPIHLPSQVIQDVNPALDPAVIPVVPPQAEETKGGKKKGKGEPNPKGDGGDVGKADASPK